MTEPARRTSPTAEDVTPIHSSSRLGDSPRPRSLDLDEVQDVAAARRWTSAVLSGVTDDELDDILLVVDELVSNAFDHGLSPRLMRLHRSEEPCLVRVEVCHASTQVPVLGRSRLGGHQGRGMLIVNRLAKDWGVTLVPHGKTVCAEVECEP
ncbi:ATP-binding protein [Lentzea atacamensis]|uniref:ATP-binding protein n=1 Tax=Lentzea atacamensis TaxID=531938 RepID=UPI001473EB20|nr:ATP-binding protein [Lentzea atacamensis]